jgi:hypothetical protein
MMKRILIHMAAIALLAGCTNQQKQLEQSAPAALPDTPWTSAMSHSDFVFVCKVVDEGPLGHGSDAVQKSYMVSYPESLHFGLVGLVLPGEIWIHYDSARYPEVPKSGYESTFHKGDSFIAFLDYINTAEFGFQIVRLDKIEMKEDIKRVIKNHRTRK